MKNVLIVTYFFPPGNFTAAERAKSFAENFKKYGLNPTVVTRHWKGNETGEWMDFASFNEIPLKITKNESYTLIQLPYSVQGNVFLRTLKRIPALRRFIHLIGIAFGKFFPQENADKAFYEYLNAYLKENRVNYLIVISSPLNIIKLGHRLARKFDLPLIADFRDLWDNNLLKADYRPGLQERVKNFFYEFYLRKWLKSAALITSVSPPLVKEIERLCPEVKTMVVMNGFERAPPQFSPESAKIRSPKFTFSVTGALYPHQDLSILIEGLKLFLKDKDLAEIQLNFIGTAVFPQVKSLLEKGLPKECTVVTTRIPQKDARQKAIESHVLFYAGWKGYKGIVSAKIFEYLGSERNILIAPSDDDIIAQIVSETDAGKTADSPEEFAEILNHWYQEWKTNGDLIYRGKPEKIKLYSRENQAKLFAEEIKKIK